MRSQSQIYFFRKSPDLSGFEYIDTTGKIFLADCIGDTLAYALCDGYSDLELVRFHRYGLGETIIAHKQIDRIKLTISYAR